MLASPGKSIPQCTGSIAAARAFYRVLDNELLTDTLILDTHRVGVLRRAQASGVEVSCGADGCAEVRLSPAQQARAGAGGFPIL